MARTSLRRCLLPAWATLRVEGVRLGVRLASRLLVVLLLTAYLP